ncbi:MAG: hypothetical protein IE889_01955 [Campylobacterales bacterium]|nr:hypothetical protein [Campylobacterales bacterium]
MLLKLLIALIVIVVIYRWFGGRISFIDRKELSDAEQDFGQIQATSACANCGTYITEDDAIIYQRKAYCSQSCLNAAKKH